METSHSKKFDQAPSEVSGLEPEGAFSSEGVDRTLIHWMLGLSYEERLQAAQDMIDTVWMLREGRELPT